MNVCNENESLLMKFEAGQLEEHRLCTAGAHNEWKQTRFPNSCVFLFVKSKLYTHNLSRQGLLFKQNPSLVRKFIYSTNKLPCIYDRGKVIANLEQHWSRTAGKFTVGFTAHRKTVVAVSFSRINYKYQN